MEERFYAHTLPGQHPDRWQPLGEHLLQVARLAGTFAASFNAGDWGYLAGLWHDAGKFSRRFQAYLAESSAPDSGKDYHREEVEGAREENRHASDHVDHSTAGAQHAVASPLVCEPFRQLLAFAIAGHHAGLPDAISEGTCLEKRLRKEVDPWDSSFLDSLDAPRADLPGFVEESIRRLSDSPEDGGKAAFAVSFFTRMIFSCLVDADFLDTEQFMDPERAAARPRWPEGILSRMEELLDRHVASFSRDGTPVHRERQEVRRACLAAAPREPGLFSLTVPTGGGKTLSSLAFALRHARLHGLRRVVYVIPFTSIIEQTAEVFREVFRPLREEGWPDPVVEHHSALDAGVETVWNRLAAENWDAPLVVTTSVQFYESLFSHRPGRCRKLHNLSRAVVILDEAQKIPVNHLSPCLAALQELVDHYGTTVVLCTATQPAVTERENFPIGLRNVREIIPDPGRLYLNLKRVEVEPLGLVEDSELAARLRDHEQVLCIVNTRRHARLLFEQLKDAGEVFHLSAAMCPAHRSAVLSTIRDQLRGQRPCRVVSTQLVEAGVDLDFPVVYRSLAGIDSIAQAAGRCNRNGRLHRGRLRVFRSEHGEREAFLRDTVNVTVQLMGADGQEPLFPDLLSLEAVDRYFRIYYRDQEQRWDERNVLSSFLLNPGGDPLAFLFPFRTVGRSFRLIEDSGKGIVVPWGEEGWLLAERLRESGPVPGRNLLRHLQRYTVTVPSKIFSREEGRSIELVRDRYPVLISPECHYHDELGVVLDSEDAGMDLLVS